VESPHGGVSKTGLKDLPGESTIHTCSKVRQVLGCGAAQLSQEQKELPNPLSRFIVVECVKDPWPVSELQSQDFVQDKEYRGWCAG
jgi:hypothetical protein